MAIAVSLTYKDVTRRREVRGYTLTLSGSYSTGGDTMNLLTATNPNKLEKPLWSKRKPTGFEVQNFTTGFAAEIIPGTDNTAWLLKIENGATGAELAAGAYPAALTADVNIRVEFSGPQGL
jgi:hypothetical protein